MAMYVIALGTEDIKWSELQGCTEPIIADIMLSKVMAATKMAVIHQSVHIALSVTMKQFVSKGKSWTLREPFHVNGFRVTDYE